MPDGLHPLFFQKFQNITQESVCSTILNIWDTVVMPHDLNKTYTTLISKTENVENYSIQTYQVM